MQGSAYGLSLQLSLLWTLVPHKAQLRELELYQVSARIRCTTWERGKSSRPGVYNSMKTDDASAPCCVFSPDITLMAAGFSESYIRLWSLKGEKFKGLWNDKSPDSAKNCRLFEVSSSPCI